MKRLNSSVLKTAVFELVQQFYHAAKIGNIANASDHALISHSRPSKDNCFG